MAILLSVLLPPIFFTVAVVALLALYTWRIFMGSPKGGNDSGSEPSPASSDVDVASKDEQQGFVDNEAFRPLTLSWYDVCVTVKRPGAQPKAILTGCVGEVVPGEMMAIVGPSGAGKSTLLDVLAMRVKATSGCILVEGQAVDATFRRTSTYVPQEDSFVPTLTVWETLALVSRLRLPERVRKAERYRIVDGILLSMGLAKVKHSQVGGLLPGGLSVRGISGGERRRLNISCGIVAAPSIIFLDEPTSGLDSHAALVLMRYMGRLAAMKRTIICSIHQPRQSIWELFNKLELLSEGHLLYFGAPSDVVAWFSGTLGYQYNPRRDGVTSDWLLDLVSVGFTKGTPERDSVSGDRAREHRRRMTSVADICSAAERFKQEGLPPALSLQASMSHKGSADAGEIPSTLGLLRDSWAPFASRVRSTSKKASAWWPWGAAKREEGPVVVSGYPTEFWNQMVCLMWRALMASVRNPADVACRLVMCLSIGVFCGLVFINATNDDMGAQSQLTVMYFALLVIMLYPFTQMSLYVADRHFYIADVASNLYRPVAYFMATTIVAAPFNMVSGLIMFLTMYGIVGLRLHATVILVSCACVALFSVICIQILVLAAYVSSTQDVAIVLSTIYVLDSMLWAGALVRLKDLWIVLQILSYATPCRYVMQIVMRQQFLHSPRASTLKIFDFMVPDILNFAALAFIYAVLLVLSLVALLCLSRRSRK